MENVNCQEFSAKRTWNILRPRAPEQSWTDTVWFKQSLPKHAFTMWIANMDRLPTITRLASWGLAVRTSCCLCSQSEESRDHLLLTCDYSIHIWSEIMIRVKPTHSLFQGCIDLMEWSRVSSPTAPSILKKLMPKLRSSSCGNI